MSYVYKVIGIDSMYDGDSVNVVVRRVYDTPPQKIDFGFGDIVTLESRRVTKITEVNVRMHGYDTPELRDKRPDWKAAAYLAKNEAREWMDKVLGDNELYMETYKDKTGKFGRYLANFSRGTTDLTLGRYLIDHHLAVPYHGQNKAEVEVAHAANIKVLKDEGII